MLEKQWSFVVPFYLLSSQISIQILYAERQFKKNDTLSIDLIQKMGIEEC